MRISPVFAVLSLCLVVGSPAAQAQVVKPVVKPTVQNVDACCAITSIDGETGIVTARVTASRRALAFKVTDKVLLGSLRIGQVISADLKSRRVTVNGVSPCCEIVTLEPDGIAPCCAITGINGATGLITARIVATGREFTFKVANAALLPALRIGQAISADFPANSVSVYPVDPCCAIVSAVTADASSAVAKPAAPPPAKVPAASAAPEAPTGLGTHPYEVSGVEVVLMSVQRTSGNTLTVRWEYRNTTSQPRKIGESFGGMGWSEPFSLVYDAYLIDGRTRYPVQKDETGNLIAARHGAGKIVTIAAKETHASWARFASPPEATTKITVFIPGTEPFEDIPIKSSGSGVPARQRR
jgi:hypothetical protein